MKKLLSSFSIVALLLATASFLPAHAEAEKYIFDKKGQHAFIQFRIKHMGFSWLYGQFNDFDGRFSFDEEDPSKSQVVVLIQADSVDTNHAERDKHLRGDDFLDVEKFPTASFISTGYMRTGENTGKLAGELTLHGVKKEIFIDVEEMRAGEDPWGGYRRGFSGTTELTLSDFGIQKDLGPFSQTVELMLSIEGIRQ